MLFKHDRKFRLFLVLFLFDAGLMVLVTEFDLIPFRFERPFLFVTLILGLVFLLLMLYYGEKDSKRFWRLINFECPDCGYDWNHSPSPNCPECGYSKRDLS